MVQGVQSGVRDVVKTHEHNMNVNVVPRLNHRLNMLNDLQVLVQLDMGIQL